MFIKNQKGFTLVELLAVIVILAIIILVASNNVFTQIGKARQNALALEGNTLIDSARIAYQNEILDGNLMTGGACFSLEYLYEAGLFTKGPKDHYSGSVLVKPSGNQVTYKFWIGNGSYNVVGETGTTGTAATENTGDASSTCGEEGNGAKQFDKSSLKGAGS